MIVIDKDYIIRRDNVHLNRAYSDEGFYIIDDGIKYAEIVYPNFIEKHFIESDEKIPEEN